MSLTSSLYAGVSGLTTSSQELGVVGDNIANANTIGFKQSRASFEDMMSQSLIGGQGQIGMGAKLATVQKILTQGALTTTGLTTDMALQGPGFFVVEGADGPLYTRNGQFSIDNDGFMTALDGNRVQGFPADATGDINGTLGDMQVGQASDPAVATSEFTLRANLDPGAGITPSFNPLDIPGTTETNAATPITIFDSLGNAHEATIHYTHTAEGAWEYNVTVPDGGDFGGNAGDPLSVVNGELSFDIDGNLIDLNEINNAFNPPGANQPQPLTFDFGFGPGSEGETTQMGGQAGATFVSQDGHASGQLAGFSIDAEGNIVGAFTNGETRTLAQVAVADFSAPDQLDRMGGNYFRDTPGAGEVVTGAPGGGGRGTLASGALEQSNVDLSNEFVRMIIAQRSFQASSKTVTTADTLLGELVQMKR